MHMPVVRPKLVGDRLLGQVVSLVLLALAVNAVLIQTVITDDSPFKTVIRVGAMGLLLLGLLGNDTKLPRWVVPLILLSAGLWYFRGNSDQLSYVFVLILVSAMLPLDERRVLKSLAVCSVLSVGLVFALLWGGVTHNEVLVLRERQTFGTQGVPFFYNLVYGAAALVIVYTRRFRPRRRRLTFVACLGVATALFAATDARGGYYSLLGFVVLLWLVPKLARAHPLRVLTALLPVLFLPFAFYLASLADDPDANALWSNRPHWFSVFLGSLNPEDFLLSTSVKYYTRVVTIVDNSYLHLLVGGGLVLFLAVAILFFRAVMNLYRLGRFTEVAFLIATCFYFNSESILLRIENLFVIYFWYLMVRFSIRQSGSGHGDGHAALGRAGGAAAADRPHARADTGIRGTGDVHADARGGVHR